MLYISLLATAFFDCFPCNCPTSWKAETEIDNLNHVLVLLGDNCYHVGAILIVAGDFNASLGSRLSTDDAETFGFCGAGVRNESGWMLSRWVHQTSLIVQSR